MISMIPEGKNYRALPEEYRVFYKYHEALTRYNSNKPSLTINTGHRSYFHYKYNRIPTQFYQEIVNQEIIKIYIVLYYYQEEERMVYI